MESVNDSHCIREYDFGSTVYSMLTLKSCSISSVSITEKCGRFNNGIVGSGSLGCPTLSIILSDTEYCDDTSNRYAYLLNCRIAATFVPLVPTSSSEYRES